MISKFNLNANITYLIYGAFWSKDLHIFRYYPMGMVFCVSQYYMPFFAWILYMLFRLVDYLNLLSNVLNSPSACSLQFNWCTEIFASIRAEIQWILQICFIGFFPSFRRYYNDWNSKSNIQIAFSLNRIFPPWMG